MTWRIVNLKKKVKPVKVVNYNINAANCYVLTMMEYVHCLRYIYNYCVAICRQIIFVDIEVKYEVCLKGNGTGSINVLFYLTSKFYNMSPSK